MQPSITHWNGRSPVCVRSWALSAWLIWKRLESCPLLWQIVFFLHLHPLRKDVAQLPLVKVLDMLVQVCLAEVGSCAALNHALEGPLPCMRPLVTLELLLDLEGGSGLVGTSP